ncbi:MAG: AI-2E family transporter [Deltaproteobacteria bacterium]|nr:AI-2E family transporter [Deltaproteobacteria bacterium]
MQATPSSASSTSAPAPALRVRNAIWTAGALVVLVYGLVAAQSILVPVLTAVFLALICAPAVRWLERRRIPKAVAVLAVVAAAMLLLGAVGGLIGASVAGFRESIPTYQHRLAGLSEAALGWAATRGIKIDLPKIMQAVDLGSLARKAMEYVGRSMGALASVLSNTILVVVTMVLILIEGATVPGKLRILSGDPDADISHFDRIAVQVQQYLGIKTVLGLGTGLLVGLFAGLLGVDFPLLWGLLAFLLNYIPAIGAILAAVPPCLLALVQPGPWTAVGLAAGFVVINVALGAIEPLWMGRRLGLSTVVVFLSLVVWGGIWGPVGMLLSVPLTMVIKIMLENSKEWAFVAALLDKGGAEQGERPSRRKPPSPEAPEATEPPAAAQAEKPAAAAGPE